MTFPPPHQTPALVARFQQWASAEGEFLQGIHNGVLRRRTIVATLQPG